MGESRTGPRLRQGPNQKTPPFLRPEGKKVSRQEKKDLLTLERSAGQGKVPLAKEKTTIPEGKQQEKDPEGIKEEPSYNWGLRGK